MPEKTTTMRVSRNFERLTKEITGEINTRIENGNRPLSQHEFTRLLAEYLQGNELKIIIEKKEKPRVHAPFDGGF